ncbi:MAG: hypothetical protein ABSA52_23870 [Candidatus Binatia bacterium]
MEAAQRTPLPPPPRPKGRSKWRLGCGGLLGLLVVVVVLAIIGHQAQEHPTEHATATSGAPVERVGAEKLAEQFRENEVLAEKNWKGKTIDVAGEVKDIGVDIIGNPYVVLNGREFVDVQCTGNKKARDAMAQLRKGQFLTVRGVCNGKMMNVQLGDCTLPPPPTPDPSMAAFEECRANMDGPPLNSAVAACMKRHNWTWKEGAWWGPPE